MHQYKVADRIQEEISRAKIFSIIVYTLAEQVYEVGLLDASDKQLKGPGIKKYQLKNNHLCELYCLFK